MSGSLMQYTCCDWDIIDKMSYNKPRETRDMFRKYNFTVETYERFLVYLEMPHRGGTD